VSQDYVKHLAALHHGWATPLSVVAAAVGEVAKGPVLDIRRIVQGEQTRSTTSPWSGLRP
jgi:hypothetical protein